MCLATTNRNHHHGSAGRRKAHRLVTLAKSSAASTNTIRKKSKESNELRHCPVVVKNRIITLPTNSDGKQQRKIKYKEHLENDKDNHDNNNDTALKTRNDRTRIKLLKKMAISIKLESMTAHLSPLKLVEHNLNHVERLP